MLLRKMFNLKTRNSCTVPYIWRGALTFRCQDLLPFDCYCCCCRRSRLRFPSLREPHMLAATLRAVSALGLFPTALDAARTGPACLSAWRFGGWMRCCCCWRWSTDACCEPRPCRRKSLLAIASSPLPLLLQQLASCTAPSQGSVMCVVYVFAGEPTEMKRSCVQIRPVKIQSCVRV